MWVNGRMISFFIPQIILGGLEWAIGSPIPISFLLSRFFVTFLIGSRPRPDLEEADLTLVQCFNSLSKDWRSYKNIITLERLSRHGFHSPALTFVSASTSGEVWTYTLFVTLFPFSLNFWLCLRSQLSKPWVTFRIVLIIPQSSKLLRAPAICLEGCPYPSLFQLLLLPLLLLSVSCLL